MFKKLRATNERRREFRTHFLNILAFYPGGWKEIVSRYPALEHAHTDTTFAHVPTGRLALMAARKVLNDLLEATPDASRQRGLDELQAIDWGQMRLWTADLLEGTQKDMLPHLHWSTVITATAFVVASSLARRGLIEIEELNEFQDDAIYALRGIPEQERTGLLIKDALDDALGLKGT